MILNVIVYTSEPQNINRQNLLKHPLLQQLHEFAKLRIFPASEINTIDRSNLTLLLALNGNATKLIRNQFEDLPRPILFLTSEEVQNLPILLEVTTWLNSNSINSEILIGETATIKRRLENLERILSTGIELKNQRVGIIKSPSSQLIASNVDYFLIKKRWGVDFLDIPIEYNPIVEYTTDFKVIKKEIPDNIDFYTPLNLLIQSEELNGLALDLLKTPKKLQSSIVSAVDKLTKKEISITYSRDPQSLFTMLVSKLLVGNNSSTLVSPIQMDMENNNLKLMTYPMDFDKINNLTKGSTITLVKCGGSCLDQFYLSTGTLLSNSSQTEKQQAIINIQMNSPVKHLLNKPLGSHYILIPNNHCSLFEEFFLSNRCFRM